MAAVFNVLVYVVLVACALGMIAVAARIVLIDDSRIEIVMRSLAAIGGLLTWAGSKALGLSIPELMLQSLSLSLPISIGLIGVIFPAGAGFLIAWYVVRQLHALEATRDVIAARVLAMIVAFAFFVYTDTLLATFSAPGERTLVNLLPNLTFTTAILFYSVFKYRPGAKRLAGKAEAQTT